ncbi:ImmA/IrrE family metallo-endopeptidase [Maricaulis sp.]|uniref:ImmA/IrrE family metallo-endopeptidase n=1 Tax=Maricaulis sp. TaxID=1486257 RepID=UPI003A8F5C57
MVSNNTSTSQPAPNWVSPPGHTIVSILEERELTVEDFAREIGRTAAAAQKIVDGVQAIDVDLAQRLADTLGASPSFWIAREHDYRGSIAAPEGLKISNLQDFVSRLPMRDMQRFGWVATARSNEEKIAETLAFFGVSSLAQWQGRYEGAFETAAYRKSAAHSSCPAATTAWLRQGEIETADDPVAVWSSKILSDQLPKLRRLTWQKRPLVFLPKLKALLAEAGVKIAVVRAPKGCSASGAVRVLEGGVPHIQMSFRYLSDDHFWFTLFHEIGHLLLHYSSMPILELNESQINSIENEANEFASSTIVPLEHREEMLNLGGSRFPIVDFAKKIGIAPGLVVGQLQHLGIIRYNQMQHLKRRFRWSD